MTEWVLVLITLTFHGHPIAEEIGRYDDMIECFWHREELALELGRIDGHFPVNTQAVCIQHNPE